MKSFNQLIHEGSELVLELLLLVLAGLPIIEFKVGVPEDFSPSLHHTLHALVVIRDVLFQEIVHRCVQCLYILLFDIVDGSGQILGVFSDLVNNFAINILSFAFEMF